MNLTKFGDLLKNALKIGSKGIFIESGKYLKPDRVGGSQREDQDTVPPESLPQPPTPGTSEESPVVTAITRLIEDSGLHGEIVTDTTTLRGSVSWERAWESRSRKILFALPPCGLAGRVHPQLVRKGWRSNTRRKMVGRFGAHRRTLFSLFDPSGRVATNCD